MGHAVLAVLDLPDQGWGLCDEDEEEPTLVGIPGQVWLGELMLALPGGTVDQGDTLFLGPGMDTPAEDRKSVV